MLWHYFGVLYMLWAAVGEKPGILHSSSGELPHTSLRANRQVVAFKIKASPCRHMCLFFLIIFKKKQNSTECRILYPYFATNKENTVQVTVSKRANPQNSCIFVFCFTCEIVETDQLLQWPCRPNLHHRDEFTVKPTFKHDLDFIGPIRRATGSRQVTRDGPRYKQRSFIAYNRMFLKRCSLQHQHT